MTSQDGMARLARAVSNLTQAMNLMVDQQEQLDLQAARHEERIRASEEELRAIRIDLREKAARIRELVGAVNQIEAEIARLDSAS